jgi:hypothetical protein
MNFLSARAPYPLERKISDLLQAATLAAVLTEQEDQNLSDSLREVPREMKKILRLQLPEVQRVLSAHARVLESLEAALA